MSGPAPGDGRVPAATVSPVLRAVMGRPWLWPTAAVLAVRLAPTGWWRRWPLLPLPDAALWRFRMETAYGGAGDRPPEERDVLSFVHWSRDMPRWRKG